jgi:hypothetical protein
MLKFAMVDELLALRSLAVETFDLELYVPARTDWDGVDLAQAWIREVIRLHGGVPSRIISDRGPMMNANH